MSILQKVISHISAYQLFWSQKPQGMEKVKEGERQSQIDRAMGKIKAVMDSNEQWYCSLDRLKHASLPIHLCNKNTMDKSF